MFTYLLHIDIYTVSFKHSHTERKPEGLSFPICTFVVSGRSRFAKKNIYLFVPFIHKFSLLYLQFFTNEYNYCTLSVTRKLGYYRRLDIFIHFLSFFSISST